MIITRHINKLTIWLGALALAAACVQVRAVDFHCATAQDLQNALTLAAANGANNNIYLTNGSYIGNFNFNSSGGYNLTIENEPNVTNNTQIAIDGAGTGRDMNLANTGTGNIIVQGITFLRNCGNSGIGALRVAVGSAATILIQNCQFLSPINTSGMGLELDSGLNATVTNCTAAGSTIGGGGTGISISGVTGNVTVQNCAATTNNSTGISVYGASVTAITGNIFIGNSGYYVGGAYCSDNTMTLTGNTFIGNSGRYVGGAFCDGLYDGPPWAGTTTLIGNTFIGNSGDYGGGAFCRSGLEPMYMDVTLTGNTFIGNSGYSAGGACCETDGSGGMDVTLTGNSFTGNSGSGVFCEPSEGAMGVVTLTDNTFTGNSANGSPGGGAYCYGGTVTLTNNTFTGNSANGSPGGGAYAYGSPGGGAYAYGSGTVTVSGNTFQQNNAATGGGIYASGSTINLLDNLVAKNSQASSSSQGGGVWVDASSNLFMINNTVTGNTAAGSGGGVAYEVTGTVELLNVYNNIIWGNLATVNGGDVYLSGTGQKKVFDFNDADSLSGVWDIAQNNIDLSPQFFDPVNGDYHIQSTSPCRNAGTNGAPSLPLTDLDGNSRTNSAGLVDMGCYEFNTTATHPADTDTNWVISTAEFNTYSNAWKNGLGWTNGPITADYVTRAGYLMTNNAGLYTNDGSARPVNWKTVP